MENLENEVWKDIPNYDGVYQVSNYARLKNCITDQILTTGRDQVRIYKNAVKDDIPLIKLMRDLFPNNEDLSKFAKIKSFDGELWLPVKNYENIYHISNFGRLKILDRVCWKSVKDKTSTRIKCEKISASFWKTGWYPNHILVDEQGNKRTECIHRLVASHFIPNPDNKPQINHKDGNKANNHVDNLEWVTCSENSQHAHDTGLSKPPRGTKHYMAKIDENRAREVKEILKTRVNNKPSLGQIAKDLGISRSCVREIHENKSWKYVKI